MLRQIKGLAPGIGLPLSATMDATGQVVIARADIADALRCHCRSPFSHRPIDERKLREWLRHDVESANGLKSAVAPLLKDTRAWHVKKSDVMKAIEMVGKSAQMVFHIRPGSG